MWKKLGIKGKILTGVLSIVVLMMIITTMINTRVSFNILYNRIMNKEAPASVNYIAEKFEVRINKAVSISKLIADNPFLLKWSSEGEPEDSKPEALSFLKEVKKHDMDFVFLVSKSTKNYYTHDGYMKTVDPNVERDDWFFSTLEGKVKASINIEPSEQSDDLMAFINVIMGDVNNPVGVAGAGINLIELSNSLKEIKLSENSIAYLIGEDGNIKAHPDKLKLSQNIDSFDDANYQTTIAPELLSQMSGSVEYTTKDGVDKLVVFKDVETTGWKVVIETPVKELGKGLGKIRTSSLFLTIVSIILIAVIVTLILNIILRAVRKVIAASKELSEGEGDLTKRIFTNSNDEIGELANWFNKFIEKNQSIIKIIKQNSNTVADNSNGLSSLSENLSTEANSLQSQSQSVSAATEQMSSNLNTVASSMEETTISIDNISKAVNEMNSTISEIAGNTEKANAVTDDAVNETDSAQGQINELGDAANKIGKVIDTIAEISDQTNLLALNATIEAARAGDAGKGFAVVANEIKELASQTNVATEDIRKSIQGIQNSTDMTVDSIKKVSNIINEVSSIVGTIASAVEEQSVTIKEISSNISDSSTGLNEVNVNVNQLADASKNISNEITDVNSSTGAVNDSSIKVKERSEQLKKLSDELKNVVDKFKV